jgi:glycosyltransferase involved in cell wall biosynthesis
MLVIFVLPDLPRSGAATRTVHLAEGLASSGISVVVAAFGGADPDLAARLRTSGVDVLHLLPSAWRLGRYIRSQPDIVLHAAMPTAGLAGWLLSRWYRLPMVYSYTNCLHSERPFRRRTLMDSLKACIERFIALRCDVLHAVSESVAEQLATSFPQAAERVQVFVHPPTPPIESVEAGAGGIDLAEFAGAYPKLLAVGRLLPHKRFDDAVRAVAILRNRWPRAVLVIAGSGPEFAQLRALTQRLGVDSNVKLTGQSRRLTDLFAWADVLVHPSLYEGYPRVGAEARSLAVPIVSVDSPYGRELVRSGRLVRLARPCDSQSLAAAIIDVITFSASELPGYGDTQQIEELSETYRRLAVRTRRRKAWVRRPTAASRGLEPREIRNLLPWPGGSKNASPRCH